MTWPSVSFVIPAWNAERWIEKAVESCVRQDYPGVVEIVVADDGSEDGTRRAVESLRLHLWRWRIVLLEMPHGGYARAFNLALAEAGGDMIARQDADDWSAPDRLRKQVEALRRADIVSSEMTLVDEQGRYLGETEDRGMDPARFVSGAEPHGVCGVTLVAWRRVYEMVGPFSTDPRWEWSPDTEWTFRALRAGLRWAHIPKPLYFYRRHPGQMTTRGGTKGHEAYVAQSEEHQKWLRERT